MCLIDPVKVDNLVQLPEFFSVVKQPFYLHNLILSMF